MTEGDSHGTLRLPQVAGESGRVPLHKLVVVLPQMNCVTFRLLHPQSTDLGRVLGPKLPPLP